MCDLKRFQIFGWFVGGLNLAYLCSWWSLVAPTNHLIYLLRWAFKHSLDSTIPQIPNPPF